MRKNGALVLVCLLAAAVAAADELGVGSTRDEVVAQLGAPKSKMSANGREILGYPNGRVTLVDGKVESIDWKGSMPARAPVPAPVAARAVPAVATASASTPAIAARASRPASSREREPWFTDFAAAQAEAAASKRRLLVLFTGTDWCPACVEFETNVAHADDFLNVTRPAFVLVKLDYLQNHPQPEAVRARYAELARRYGVETYPSLFVISADGEKSSRVETRKPRQADDIVDFYVQAVDEARRAKAKSSFWPW